MVTIWQMIPDEQRGQEVLSRYLPLDNLTSAVTVVLLSQDHHFLICGGNKRTMGHFNFFLQLFPNRFPRMN